MMGKETNEESHYILKHIPKRTIGAEIGVWAGHTAKNILITAHPAELHLVDPWSKEPYKQQVNSEHNSYEEYLKKYSKVTGGDTEEKFDAYYDKMFKKVKAKFDDDSNVTIHRMWSKEFFDTFKGKLDWIYIDGDHSYEGCYADLNECLKIMQPNCIIFGDDYAWNNGNGKPGVTKAVSQFVEENSLTLVQLGNREYMIKITQDFWDDKK
jgi:hypothetical protein